LAAHRIPILRASDVRVRTSARSVGRVARGLSVDLAVSSWLEQHRYRADTFAIEDLQAAKGAERISVIIPTKRCAETIGPILDTTVAPLRQAGLVDEVLVIDARTGDGTPQVAAAHGARVVDQDDVRPELGPALGKGDAMWRALQVTGGDIVAFLDGDTGDPHSDHLLGLLGPLLTHRSLSLVKGAFDRPLRAGEVQLPHEGGRVTELMARPLINLHEPLLAGFAQPLAGEFAVRRALLEAIPMPAGYGVEIAVLVDVLRMVGLDGLAECHLGTRQNRHQPLRSLGEMAYAVLAALENRLGRGATRAGGHYLKPWEDGAVAHVPILERPPIGRSALRSARRAPAPA
jgi:glucosyl-3-phosphoglycerate synthase